MTELYTRIFQEKAKEMIDTLDKYIILDVRIKEEYENGYIKGVIKIESMDDLLD